MKFEDIQLESFKQAIPAATLNICVIVPVKNEADHLNTTLTSLVEQVGENGDKIAFGSYEVLVLVNNSNDESLQIAKDFQSTHPTFCLHVASIELPKEMANIGTVRKLLMDEAYRRFCYLKAERGIIASIDGDTFADEQWLYQIRKEIEAGNDAVGGHILTREKAGSAEKAYLQDMKYRYLLTEVEQLLCPQLNDPLPRHFQFFGANMAVTAEYYQKAGGIPLVENLEDMAFHKALIRCDARIRRSLNVKVVTSTRFEGRVAIGFSEQLKKWSDESQEKIPQVVEDTSLFIYACFLKGQFQTYWKNKGTLSKSPTIKVLASTLGVPAEWLKIQVASHDFFGAFWEAVWEASAVRQNKQQTYEPIQTAIRKLKKFIQNPDVTAFQTSPVGNYRYADVISA